jgi:uncharacterized protein YuzE
MHITYDPKVDAAYVYLTDVDLPAGRDSIPLEMPADTSGMVVMDWRDGKIVGLEVLDASSLLHPDLLARAERLG